MLTVIGVLAGILTSLYFSHKSEQQNLGKYASAAYRLSVRINDSITETLSFIDRTKESAVENQFDPKTYAIGLDVIAEKLKVIQQMSHVANDNWHDVLPDEKRGKRIAYTSSISQEREVHISEEVIPLDLIIRRSPSDFKK